MFNLTALILAILFTWNGIFCMQNENSEELQEETIKTKKMYTYSKQNPIIDAHESILEHNVDINEEILEGSLGISLDMTEQDFVDNLGVSLENAGLGISFLESPEDENCFLVCSEDPLNTSNLDCYTFENLTDDEALQGPSFSTPVKPLESANSNFTPEKDDTSFLNLSSSSVYSDISISNINTDELDISLATPKVPTSISTEGRTSTFLLEKYITSTSIHTALNGKCCQNKCLQLFTYTEFKTFRSLFWSKSTYQQDNFILEKFRSANFKRGKFEFFENGKCICPVTVKELYKINKNRFTNLKKRFLEGAIQSAPMNKRTRSEKYLEAMNWLELYAFCHADRMPDSEKLMLPYKTRKIIIYRQYKEEISNTLSRSAFYNMWTNDFSNLQIKPVNCFSKCTKCTSIERQLEVTTHPRKRRKLLLARNEHNRRQMVERQYYYKKREAAKRSPSKYLSLIIDGMDQSKSNLPHFVGRIAKAINPGDQLKTHISGIIAHGQHKLFTFLDIGQYAHDSNLTMNLILMTLKKLTDMMKGNLPQVLYLQADNCWRENKNKYMLAFCELLVAERIFNEVQLSFLMVGHTHEDIDASFSKIADTLRQNDAETLPELINLLPGNTEINCVYDVRSWLSPAICDIRKHTRPLHYKFTRRLNIVETYYKGRATDIWKKIDGGLLTRDNSGNIKRIRGMPKLCPVLFERIGIEKIKSHLNHWKCLFSDQVLLSKFHWWKFFLSKWTDLKQFPNKCKREIYNKALWALPKLPKQNLEESDTDSNEESAVPESIQILLDEETEIPQVEIVKPKVQQQKKPAKKQQKTSANSSSSSKKGSKPRQQHQKVNLSERFNKLMECENLPMDKNNLVNSPTFNEPCLVNPPAN